MITNYNYVTNQEQKWYSEEEYNELEQKYIQALRKIGTLIKEKKDEGNNTRNSNDSNNANQSTMGG